MMPFTAVGENRKIIKRKNKIEIFFFRRFIKGLFIGGIGAVVISFMEKQSACNTAFIKSLQHIFFGKCRGIKKQDFHRNINLSVSYSFADGTGRNRTEYTMSLHSAGKQERACQGDASGNCDIAGLSERHCEQFLPGPFHG